MFFPRKQVNLQIPAVGCFKVSLEQAGLVCVLRKGSTLAGGELGIVTVTLFVLDQVWGFLITSQCAPRHKSQASLALETTILDV